MLLQRCGPSGDWTLATDQNPPRLLLSDPLSENRATWQVGTEISDARRVLAPATPSKIVGIGRSYRDHASELGNPVPDEPIIFLKAPSSVIASGGVVRLPQGRGRIDFEGEFALVIGRKLVRVEAEDALPALLGVTLACDITARDVQRGDPTFARAKSFDTFCPLGPAVRVDPKWDELSLVTRVNGVERQNASASDLLWSFGELVSFVSHQMALEAGDVILTGTPPGVGPLAPGDRLEIESAQIGCLTFTVGRDLE